MFHTYHAHSPNFKEWWQATDQMYQDFFFNSGGQAEDYVPLKIDVHPQDIFLLFSHDQVGICGSAALTPLPFEFESNGHVIPQGTYALRNPLFGSLAFFGDLSHQYLIIQKQFYLGLFEQVWQCATSRDHKMITSFQMDPYVHQALEDLGGFTFLTENINDEDQILIIGLMPLNKATYEMHMDKKTAFFGQKICLPGVLPFEKSSSFIKVA